MALRFVTAQGCGLEDDLSVRGSMVDAALIKRRVLKIQHNLQKIAELRHLPQVPQLIAVTKQCTLPEIEAAYAAGCRHFAENRLTPMREKFTPLLARYPDITLHFIGHLQTNKVARVLAMCQVIHSVDRDSLVHKLAEEAQRQACKPHLLLQINLAGEGQKSGVAPAQAAALLATARARQLSIRGLMCIPPRDAADPQFYFNKLKLLAQRLGLEELSMGMSADYQEAALCGTSWVRVGRGIFCE